VVRQLAEEFFSGHGARDDVRRTIFAVGDEKQSIYSFQGADPTLFADSGRAFEQKVAAAEASFRSVKLNWSFRSTDDILSAVDRVFANDNARKGLTRDPEPIEHKAIRAGAPGYVEVWPSIGAEVTQEPEDWREAIDHATAPAVRLADTIAATIAGWIRDGETIEGKGRALDAGDVLVLVRKRDRFIHALSRRLKDHRVAVTGADRLSLGSHIAVKDLAALGRVALQPHDDLSLAALLRSPIFGLKDADLFGIAHGRAEDTSLQQALRRKASSRAAFADVVATLDRWSNEAAFKPVFDFYAGVLGRDGVRRKLIGRLGPEAGDIIDEFLSFCLAEEKTGLPGLEAFLATLDTAAPEIKREMDQGRPEVRIMTAHAAKGLEAPVVFLVDNGSRPFSEQHLPRLLPIESRRKLWDGRGYLWRAASDMASGSSRAAAARIKDAAEEEYRRLLYVGMTRAEDRLIVCGYHGKQAQMAGTWHSLVTAALANAGNIETFPDPVASGETRFRYRTTPLGVAVKPARKDKAGKAKPGPAPVWLGEPVPPEQILPRPLTPSRAAALIEPQTEAFGVPRSPVLEDDGEPSFAIARGLAIHKLLQVLPDLPGTEREAAARRYLERIGDDWPATELEEAARSALAILEDPAFAPLFSATSRAEVGISGTIPVDGVERAISGKIDRLAVTEKEVLLVDYKTNRPTPQSLAEVPEPYVLQLALYRALMAPLYPGRAVRAALLFTTAPRLIALPEDVLDAALARLTRA
jgi:ATP-dependent helicase/nuclease subunit A